MDIVRYEDLKGHIWLDNKFISADKAKIHVLTHSLHFASAVFEGIRVYNKKPFKITEHLERFKKSSELLDYKISHSIDELKEVCSKIIKLQALVDGYLRPVAWRGSESMAPGIMNASIHIAIAGWRWPIYYSDKAKEKGITLDLARWKRPSNEFAPTQSKCSGLYMICTMSKHEAERKGFDDALMKDYRNYVAETTSSNIFFIFGTLIVTPIADCFLNGITRQEIIKLCKKYNLPIKEKHVTLDEAYNADSCFIAGTAAEVTPVRKILDKDFDVNNPLLIKLMQQFKKLISNN